MTEKQKGDPRGYYSMQRSERRSKKIELTLTPDALRKLKKMAGAEQGTRKTPNLSGVVNRLILEAPMPPVAPKR